MRMAEVVTQLMLDGPVKEELKIKQDQVVFPPILSKDTTEAQVQQ